MRVVRIQRQFMNNRMFRPNTDGPVNGQKEPFSDSLILHGIVKINELTGNYKMSQSTIFKSINEKG